jgi:hypothetical protein
MRVEVPTYLPVRRPPATLDLRPVDRAENRTAHDPAPMAGRSPRRDNEGFADAFMNVAVGRLPVHQSAILFEVQRLAQDNPPAAGRSERAAEAVVAYAEAFQRPRTLGGGALTRV